MDILIEDDKLRGTLNLDNRLARRMGKRRRDTIKRRMYELRAAETLDDMRLFPTSRIEEHRHYAGQHILTVALDGPDRIFFEPANDPVPHLKDGHSLDWTRVTAIRILEIGDPHAR